MKLAVVNGSPRGRKSNSDRIIGWLTDGVEDAVKVYAADVKKQDEAVLKVAQADSVLFVFPLYTDAMPGLAKAFFEKLVKTDLAGKTITFVVHSGFGEAIHSRTVERFCAYFAKINDMNYLGCVVMGGSEALQVAPDEYFGKRYKAYAVIKQNILDKTPLDNAALKTIAKREQLSKAEVFLFKLIPTGMYWNKQLKKNGAYERRYGQPYSE